MNKKLVTRQEYDETKAVVEALIAEATEKGMLEPEMDNKYTRQISELSKRMAQYEDEYMDILPLREKTPLIRSIEDYFYARNMKLSNIAVSRLKTKIRAIITIQVKNV